MKLCGQTVLTVPIPNLSLLARASACAVGWFTLVWIYFLSMLSPLMFGTSVDRCNVS